VGLAGVFAARAAEAAVGRTIFLICKTGSAAHPPTPGSVVRAFGSAATSGEWRRLMEPADSKLFSGAANGSLGFLFVAVLVFLTLVASQPARAITPPEIAVSAIPDQWTDENKALGPLSFSIAAGSTAPSDLTLAARSSNPNLLPDQSILLGGSGTNRTVTLVPGTNQFGTCSITITVSDPDGNHGDTSFALVVNPVNQPPMFVGDPPTITQPYQLYSTTITVADPDPSDQLQVSAVVLPAWLSFDASTRRLSGTPPTRGPEGDPVRLQVSDGIAPAVIKDFRIYTADFIGITNAAGVETKRQALINYIWGPDGWPSERSPARVQTNIDDPIYGSLYNEQGNLSRIDLYTVRMAYGIESHVYHFHPIRTNGRLFLFHAGHNGYGFHGDDIWMNNGAQYPGLVIPALLKEGYSVLALDMPIYSFYGSPTVYLPGATNGLVLTNHSDIFNNLERPFRFFLDPIVVTLNFALDTYGYKSVYMTGLSGGGWTTTLYGALDPRVERTYPVAGSAPDICAVCTRGPETMNRTNRAFITSPITRNSTSWVSYGENHLQFQILNLYDSCCFYGTRYTNWVDKIKTRVRELGAGSYEFFSDTTHNEHRTSPTALSLIMNSLPPLFDPIADLTVDSNAGLMRWH
jgi:hypothetical protein